MNFHVLMGPWTGITKDVRIYGHFAKAFPITPALHNSGCPWSHAIHTPICESMLVANGDGEPTKVGSDHLDGLLGLAGNPEVVSFTSVGRFIFGAIWCLTFWKRPWKSEAVACSDKGRNDEEEINTAHDDVAPLHFQNDQDLFKIPFMFAFTVSSWGALLSAKKRVM